MNELISVIVPVYNVEAYLPQCLDSIINQTYRNLEILLIDDGSKDSSGDICDQYAKTDGRIIAVHQANAGGAAARNTALEMASGYYIAFVDSDDWIEPDAFSYMVEELEKENADIIQCSYRDIYKKTAADHICEAAGRSFDQIDYLKRYTEDWTCSLLWDKLYRRELIKGIRFETGHIIDDEYFTYQVVMNAGKIICRDMIVYNYRKRKSGATGNSAHNERIVSDKIDYLTKRLDRLSETYPQLKKVFSAHFLYMMVWMSEDTALTENGFREIQKILRQRWRSCRNSGEGWRTDLKLFRLMNTNPSKYMKNKTDKEPVADDLFD